ncbi:MAG: DUF2950 family protein [Planctomycetota bacterium]
MSRKDVLSTGLVTRTYLAGFTLIELMIVIAIIAVVAAIAIPNLLTSRISGNETSAMSSLRLLTNAESVWVQQDPDNNGRKDYWTYDVSCLHRTFRGNNIDKVAYIPVDLARADWAAAAASTNTFGAPPAIEDWGSVSTGTKSGYWFQVLVRDAPGGNLYKVNTVGSTNTPACNNNLYGFMAAPDLYGMSGVNSFVVNEAGTVYANDTGNESDKWKTTSGGGLNWPGTNPAGENGPANRLWRVAD